MRNFRRSAVETVGVGKESVAWDGDSAAERSAVEVSVTPASCWPESGRDARSTAGGTPALLISSSALKSKEKLPNSVGSKVVASASAELVPSLAGLSPSYLSSQDLRPGLMNSVPSGLGA